MRKLLTLAAAASLALGAVAITGCDKNKDDGSMNGSGSASGSSGSGSMSGRSGTSGNTSGSYGTSGAAAR